MTQPNDFLTQVECDELATNMDSKYRLALKNRKFSLSAERNEPGVLVKVLLSNGDRSFYYPVEARIVHDQEEMKASEAALFLFDYIDSYFEEFLLDEDEELFLTIDWADHEYDAVDFQMRGQILNLKLEALADEWLRENDPEAPGEVESV